MIMSLSSHKHVFFLIILLLLLPNNTFLGGINKYFLHFTDFTTILSIYTRSIRFVIFLLVNITHTLFYKSHPSHLLISFIFSYITLIYTLLSLFIICSNYILVANISVQNVGINSMGKKIN